VADHGIAEPDGVALLRLLVGKLDWLLEGRSALRVERERLEEGGDDMGVMEVSQSLTTILRSGATGD
jgi:hypothetical protein